MDSLPDLRKLGGANAFHRSCASQTVLDVLSNKWAALIIVALRGGELRFGVLKRTLDGITQKSLTQGLRHLERDGLITRTVYPTIPPRVDYALTDLGRSVSGLLDAIKTWSEQNLPDILEARTAYDSKAAQPPQPVTPVLRTEPAATAVISTEDGQSQNNSDLRSEPQKTSGHRA